MKQHNKRLARSSTNRRWLGVCGGLGEYFNIDPVIFRVLTLVLTIGYSTGFWLYIILAWVLPNDYEVSGRVQKGSRQSYSRRGPEPSNQRKDVTPDDPLDDNWDDF